MSLIRFETAPEHVRKLALVIMECVGSELLELPHAMVLNCAAQVGLNVFDHVAAIRWLSAHHATSAKEEGSIADRAIEEQTAEKLAAHAKDLEEFAAKRRGLK